MFDFFPRKKKKKEILDLRDQDGGNKKRNPPESTQVEAQTSSKL